ncbi:MAG TPA: prolipoprotein diacylglyceryl transferase family protein [Gemmatimonadaceae bacterium]|jgi:phosphatidylglycerol:prolipoprotein diacylglycerol transferase
MQPFIVHHPFNFSLGPINLTGFGLAMMAAFGIAHWVSQQVLEQRGDDPAIMNDVTFAALIGTIVGAKIYYAVLQHSVSALWGRGGFVFWGGFIGAVLLSAIVIRWRKHSFFRVADAAAVGIAAGYAIGRTGCWAVGDDYGRVWNSRFAVAFPDGLPPTTVQVMNEVYHAGLPSSYPASFVVGVYPTQLLEVALGLVMFAILWRLRHHRHRAGWLFGLYCVLAGLERFVVEFFRAKSDMIGSVTSAQVVALLVAVAGVVLLTWRRSPAPTLASAR